MCLHLTPELVAALALDGDHRPAPDTREPEKESDQAAEQPADRLIA